MTTDQKAATVDEFLAIPAVQRFCAALNPFVGDSFAGLLGKYADPAQASAAMEAPATFNASIGRQMNEAMDRQQPPADRDFGRLDPLHTRNRAEDAKHHANPRAMFSRGRR